MSPDIEWRIGDESDQHTVVKSAPSSSSRWRKAAIAMVVLLGAGLGAIYTSIPEPAKQPTPTLMPTQPPALTPTPNLVSLEEAVRDDAYRLANSAGEANLGVTFNAGLSEMPQAYVDWYAALQNASGRWGVIAPQYLYTIVETGSLPNGMLWVDLRQYRTNAFFQHTRFYRRDSARWAWIAPPSSFWSGATESHTVSNAPWSYPFTMTFPVEDKAESVIVANRFARVFTYLCSDLNCPTAPDSTGWWPSVMTLTVTIIPQLTNVQTLYEADSTLKIVVPSPRVVGYYRTPALPRDPLTAMAYEALLDPIVRMASGDYDRWSTDRSGEVFLHSITSWKRQRLKQQFNPYDLFFTGPATIPRTTSPRNVQAFYADLLEYEPRIPLDSLWAWPRGERGFGLLQHVAQDEANAVVAFMENQFGTAGVTRFLNALGAAHSLKEAIESSLALTFGEFKRQWLTWIGE